MSGLVVDLFAGPGGWDVAARELDLDPIGVEVDMAACATARAAGFRRVLWDVADLDPRTFADQHGASGRPIDGLIASPPCQAFSMAGKGKGRVGAEVILNGVARIGAGEDARAVCEDVDAVLDDDRAALVLEPLRWALDLQPQWLAFEQVSPVLPLWQAVAGVLRERGWRVTTGVLSAEQFDVPQTRKRAFLIARRDRPVALPEPVRRSYRKGVAQTEGDPALLPWFSMADALGWGGARLRSNYGTGGDAANRGERASEEPAATVTSHVDRNLWQYVNGTHEHAGVRDLDQPAPTVMFGARSNTVTWQLRNNAQANAAVRDIDEPAPTITAGHDRGERRWQMAQSADAEHVARVSIEEAAALQGFPSNYPWRGSKTAQYRQVGDAVPPPLAWHVLRAVTGAEL